jgi:Phage integrase family.
MERDGTIREYPKGARTRHDPAFRSAPLGADLLARLKPAVLATAPGGLVFTASRGGPMLYPTWLRRVWDRALRVPVLDERGKATGKWEPLVAEPMPTPHDCRHTYGTRLADAGLEQHDRMALMGHKDVRSAQRYTHSGDARFDRARAALARARGQRVS